MAARAGAGRPRDHAVSAAPAEAPAAVSRKRRRFTLPAERGWFMAQALLSVGARLRYEPGPAVVNRGENHASSVEQKATCPTRSVTLRSPLVSGTGSVGARPSAAQSVPPRNLAAISDM